MYFDVVPGNLFAEEEDLLAPFNRGSVVRVLDDGEVGVGLPVLQDARHHGSQGDQAAVGGLQENLQKKKKKDNEESRVYCCFFS